MGYRKIIHVDLDAFFCSVEELTRPDLYGKPFAVGGKPENRGVVSSCSYAARMCGVRSAMPMGRALRLCPSLLVISPHFREYGTASDQVMEIIAQLTPLVEQVSIDEAFMDVSDLPQSGLEIAKNLQAQIRTETRLPCSFGIAANKLVAKIATDFGKGVHRGPTPPGSIQEVLRGNEKEFLAPLPVKALWGVGPKTTIRMNELGIYTIGQLAQHPEAFLSRNFGKNGIDLWRHANGIDDRPVETSRDVKSISQEVTFSKDVSDPKILQQTLRELSTQVGYRLRQQNLNASTVRLKLRWQDFTTISRQITLAQPANQDNILFEAVFRLFTDTWKSGEAVRLVGVGTSSLTGEVRQLSLWDTNDEKERRLLSAIDSLREQYGRDVIRRGLSKKRE